MVTRETKLKTSRFCTKRNQGAINQIIHFGRMRLRWMWLVNPWKVSYKSARFRICVFVQIRKMIARGCVRVCHLPCEIILHTRENIINDAHLKAREKNLPTFFVFLGHYFCSEWKACVRNFSQAIKYSVQHNWLKTITHNLFYQQLYVRIEILGTLKWIISYNNRTMKPFTLHVWRRRSNLYSLLPPL